MLDTKARPSRKMLTASTRPVTVIRASGGPDVGEDGHVQVLDRAGRPSRMPGVPGAGCGERPGLGGRPDGLQDHVRHGAGIGDHGEVRRVDRGDVGVRGVGHG